MTDFQGRVLSTREENRYHDSYFHALIWDDEKAEPRWVEYGGTHCVGWSHPAVDATPERRAAYEAHMAHQRSAHAQRQAECDANTPSKGKRVRVVKGRKLAHGTEGVVFWFGMETVFGANYQNGYKAAGRAARETSMSLLPPRDGLKEGRRVGILLDDGSKVFTAATNVTVIGVAA